MKIQVRHLLYFAGLVIILLSYLLHAIFPFTSTMLLLGAMVTSIICFLRILFNDQLKIILILLAFAIITFFLKLALRDWLISKSYDIVLTRNEKEFEKANNILLSKKGQISYPPTQDGGDSMFTPIEKQVLNNFLRETSVRYIRKYPHEIFYPIWGVPLNSDYGIFFMEAGGNINYHQIKGNWYFDN